MPYTKTAWVDGQAPLVSATNLNKIEQGISHAELAGLGFCTVGTGGDFATIDDAITAGMYKLYFLPGIHTLDQLYTVPIGTDIYFKGAGRGVTTLSVVTTSLSGFTIGNDDGNEYNKWMNTGTYTRNENVLTFAGGAPDATTVYAIGDKVWVGDTEDGAAIITAVDTTTVTLDTWLRNMDDGDHFGDPSWLWTIGSCGFTIEDITVTGTTTTPRSLLRESADANSYWDVLINRVDSLKLVNFSGEQTTSWRTVMNNSVVNFYEYTATRARVDDCFIGNITLGGVYQRSGLFTNCVIASVDDNSQYPCDNIYALFQKCTFLFDISAHTYLSGDASVTCKLVDCVDDIGHYIQPNAASEVDVGFVTVGTGGDYAKIWDALIAGNRNIKVLTGNHVWDSLTPVYIDPTVDETPVTIIGSGEDSTILTVDWIDQQPQDGLVVLDATNQVIGDVANTFTWDEPTRTFTRNAGSWITDGFVKDMYIGAFTEEQNPFRITNVTALTLEIEGIPVSSTLSGGSTCNRIAQYLSFDLVIKNLTIDFPANWDYLDYHTSGTVQNSARVRHVFSDMKMRSTDTGTKYPWDDGFGFPDSFTRVKFHNYLLDDGNFRPYPSPGTTHTSCYINKGYRARYYGKQLFNSCTIAGHDVSFEDTELTFLNCQFEFDVPSTTMWGTLGATNIPTYINCSDSVNGTLRQIIKKLYLSTNATTFPDNLGGADKIYLTSSATMDMTGQTQFVEGQTLKWVFTGTTMTMTFDANKLWGFDQATITNTLTATRGSGGSVVVEMMYLGNNTWHVLDYSVASDGSVVYSVV